MDSIILKGLWSSHTEEGDFPVIPLIVVGVIAVVVIVLIYLYRGRLYEFLRISDAETYVKNGKIKSSGTSEKKTTSIKSENFDPEKTTNMKTINLPKKTKKEDNE